MAKNIRSLQLLRNTQLFDDKAAAIAGIKGSATNDGTVKLARYKEEVTSGETKVEVIKTVFGICYNPSEDTSTGATGFSYTIYDSPQEVIAELTKRLNTLEGADTEAGSVANSIKTAINALNAGVFGGNGQVITTISESGGVISDTATALTADIVAATAISSGSTTIAVDGTTVKAQIASLAQHIGGLDVVDTAVSGSYVSAVSETDGKIAVTRAELPTVAEIKSDGQAIVAVKEDKGVISATAGDIAAAHVTFKSTAETFSATTVEAALESLYSQAGDGSKVTVEEAAGTETGVLKVYTIKQGGEKVGTINIPKDLVVTSGSVVKGNWEGDVFTPSEAGTGTALKLVIANQKAPVYINTLSLVKDHTAGHGIAISDVNEISVVVDTQSEDFLTVGEGGVKVSGVKTYVGDEIAKLSGETTSSGGSHVIVKVNEEAGKITAVTVSESDIASASALTNEITARKAVDGINGDAYTAKTGANYISDAGSLFDADVKLDAAIKTNADALSAETQARKDVDGQTGNTYAANTSATYISAATSLNDADVKLDAAIKASESATTDAINAEKSARETEDAKIVAGVGLTKDGDVYKIAANTGDGVHVTSASTVKDAIYTLDNALAAAKKKNALTAADTTVVVVSGDDGTKVKVNIEESATNDGNKIVTFDGAKFIYSEAILDAGTY